MEVLLSLTLIFGVCIVFKNWIAAFIIRWKYSKYSNVYMSPSFSPIQGERAVIKAQGKQKYRFWHLMEVAMKKPDCDIRIVFSGTKPLFLIYSAQACKEFFKLVPTRIDRHSNHLKHFGRMNKGAIDQIKSSPMWKSRRDKIMKVIGINFSTKFIPLILDSFHEISATWRENQWFNITNQMKKVMFSVTTKILFGKDIPVENAYTYITSCGDTIHITLEEYFSKLIEDLEKSSALIKNRLCPYLSKAGLTTSNKACEQNIENLWEILLKICQSSEDQDSVFKHRTNVCYDKKIVLMDIITVYIAGYDPTSHALASILFNIKANERVFTKVMKEVKSNYDRNEKSIDAKRKMLDSCEYLDMTIKESLRHSNPAFFSLGYKSLDEISICGVTIPKGATIFQCLHALHYNSNEWINPMEFIPERFDPDSHYFTTPSSNGTKQRSRYSYNPFSTNLRRCPGKNLAMLELKLIVAEFLSKFNYTISPEQISNKYLRFSLRSQFSCIISITGTI
ncbi:unnamed protein product [Moneuplotes crassus]|uniref:Cytochrome P450 n=1 Tax=Euplotes crassus TaxID=5936 RepID=A0AAD1UJB8_EUPCR|nr:unnamed protein product [Moneuplotes crassus]